MVHPARWLAVTALLLAGCSQPTPTTTATATAGVSLPPSPTATATPTPSANGCRAALQPVCRTVLASVRDLLRKQRLGKPGRYVMEVGFGVLPHLIVHACFDHRRDILVDVFGPDPYPNGVEWRASISGFRDDDFRCR